MRLVHEQIAARVAADPTLPAVVGLGESLTYGELDARAERLAQALRELGVGPEVTVALLAPRNPASVVAALAVLKAGGAYLPLDPAHPEERLLFSALDARARVLLTTGPLLAVFPGLGTALAATLRLDRDEPIPQPGGGLNPRTASWLREAPEGGCPQVQADPGPGNLAYVIYTSGSTGRPKGVEVEHRALANLVAWHRRIYNPRPGDRTTRLAGAGFDAAVWEIWPALAAGACLCLPPEEVLRAPDRLLAWLVDNRITQTFLPTPLAEAVLGEPWPPGAALEVMLTGGDRLHRGPGAEHTFALANHYGPTEATVCATWTIVEPEVFRVGRGSEGFSTPPPIGLPVDGATVHLVDLSGELARVPEGETGELWIGGESLARGYRHRPDLTAERFVPDPWGAPGARLYRTGDRVRQLPSGDLDFVGRLDFQVKIRGHRIELGEIEARLRSHPAVREGVVLVREEEPGDRRLVGYVAPRSLSAASAGLAASAASAGWEAESGLDARELRGFLGQTLPEPMVPASWVFLPGLPQTPNGKVDRAALARIAPQPVAGETVAPRNPVEERLAAIFGEVLGVGRVGALDDFFALGGHSLKATQVLSRLRAAFGVELAVEDLYAHPTVAALARRVPAVAAESGAETFAEIRPREDREIEIPLSYAQQELWFLARWVPGSPAYNTPMAVALDGPLDIAALSWALGEIVRRHEVLRTIYPEVHGRPVQRVLPSLPVVLPVALPVIDVSGLPVTISGRATAGRLAAEEGRRPFDLERGPVLRTILLRLGPAEHRLLLLLHHIVSDDWTFSLLLTELAALYSAAVAGRRPSPLPEPRLQYADFALWQQERLAGAVRAELLGYWRAHLDSAPTVLEVPADRPRPAGISFAGARLSDALPADLAGRLRTLARGADASLFMVLLAGWSALLGRYAGADDLLVGVPSANRNRVELEALPGMLVNTLALRADLTDRPNGAALVGRLRAATLGAFAHQDLPFPLLVEALQPARDPSRQPLLQVLFVFGNAPRPPRELAPGLGLTVSEIAVPAAKMDLSLYLVEEEGGGIGLLWEYATALFDAATVGRFAGHFRNLLAGLAGLAGLPGSPVAELPILSAAERRQLTRWNAENARVPAEALRDERLDRLFSAQAARTPGATALIVGRERLTYGDLAARVDRLARRLAARGVGPEVGVALFLPRTADLIVSMLATLAAGGFYVPLDPAYPAERLAFLLADSGARLLVTEKGLADRAPAGPMEPMEPVWVGEDDAPEAAVPGSFAHAHSPHQLAYLIYTSGSTGRPKAVGISHGSATLLMRWAQGVFRAEERAVVLAATSIAFDLSVFEIFLPLASGGTVVLAENALALPELPARDEVTLVNTVPSALAELLRQNALPASVRVVNLAGEALPRALADQVHARPEVRKLYNLYGPSEDTTYSTFALVERDSTRAPAIGRPIAGTTAQVLGPHAPQDGEPLPVGIPGELYLGGLSLARGYLGRPELTAERFVPDPFAAAAGVPGARLYRTGDLVRLRPSGDLDFLGRLDTQVKVRGFRIELGEVEAALGACPGVAAAAVLALPDATGEIRLVAYVALASVDMDAANLRSALGRRLPQSMVPTAWVFLPALPQTPNGKLDRAALARLSPPAAERTAATASTPPMTAVEERLATIFGAILGVERVTARDDFFSLGGHSLKATQVLSRMRGAFGVELSVRDLFDHPTVAALARRVEDARSQGAAQPAALCAIRPRRHEGDLPLSYAQEELWFMEHWSPGTPVYTIPTVIDLAGPLDAALLRAALGEIVRRHEALRSVYPEAQGRPVQRVLAANPGNSFPLPVLDLSALPREVAERVAQRLAGEEGRRPLDLARGPVLRVSLLRLAPAEHRLLLLVHHIVSDDWTVSLLAGELAALYGAAVLGRPSPLAEPPIQYADFTLWQRSSLQGAVLAGHAEYWRQRLGSVPQVLELPTDRPRPAEPSFAGARLRGGLSDDLAGRLGGLARAQDATLFMVLLAGWSTLLGRYAGQDDLLVGSPSANRGRVEIEGLAGLFVHTLALRTDLSGDLAGAALLAQVRETTLSAFAHQDLPFQKLVEALKPVRDPSRHLLVQAFFVFGNAPRPPRELAPGITMAFSEVDAGVSKVDLSLYVLPEAAGLAVQWEYPTALFDRTTVERFHGHFRTLLEGLAAAPETPVAALPLLTPAERLELSRWSSGLSEEVAEPTTLHRLFAEQAARTPGATALVVGRERLTYRDLAARVDRLARSLLARGVGPEVGVALFLPRTADLVVAMLGTLSAGGFYVPLDPAYPAERLAFLLGDSGAAVLVTTAELAATVPEGAAERLWVDRLAVDRLKESVIAEALPANLAYLIYTSGSTGRPKAVGIAHASAVLLVRWAQEVFPAAARAAVLAATSIAFDLSVFEIFLPLASGGTVVLAENALALAELPARGEVTLVNTVPSALAEILRLGALPGSVRTINLAGEALPRTLADQVYAQAGVERLYNLYGPSEDTTYSTFALVERPAGPGHPGDPDGYSRRAPAIGRPISGTTAYVLGPHGLPSGEPLPVGVPGELYLGGLSLARGYLGRPELTAERFLPDPFSGIPGTRLYRTGDLVRRRSTGELDFLGRLDHQVKVRGFRVELGEIETALAQVPGVAAAAVLARRDGRNEGSDLRLVAYVATAAETPAASAASAAVLRAALEKLLPGYMIPALWVFLPALPQTQNGKVDRRALPAPESERPELSAAYLAPRNDLERVLAEVWAEVLRLPRVGVHDNFFALGGDSILTIQVVARCRERGVEVLPRQIFRLPTVAGLAAVVLSVVVPELATAALLTIPEPIPFRAEIPPGDAARFPQAGLSREELADLLAGLD